MKYAVLILSFVSSILSTRAQSSDSEKAAIQNRDRYLFAAKAPKSFDVTLPVEIVNDEILIPVTINGRSYQFLFDTGAISIISPELRTQLGLDPVTSNSFTDAAGVETKQDFYMLESLSIMNIKFSQIGVASLDLDALAKIACTKIDGIVGSNLMRTCNWRIDYANKQIQFSTKKLTPKTSYDKVNFTENFSGTPEVVITTGGFNFRTLLDTGNNGHLDISEDLFLKSRLSKAGNFTKSSGKGFYALSGGSFQNEFKGTADSLYIGDILLRKQIVRASPSPMFMIGNGFLKQFGEIVLHWDKKQLLLPKKTSPLEPFRTFGFTPVSVGDHLEVGVIWENSLAQRNGLEVGDRILSIDGEDFSTITNDTWCAMRNSVSKKERLEIRASKPDGRILSLTLDKYNL